MLLVPKTEQSRTSTNWSEKKTYYSVSHPPRSTKLEEIIKSAVDKAVINSLQGRNSHCWVDTLADILFPTFNSCESMEKSHWLGRDEACRVSSCHNFTLSIWQRLGLQSKKFRYDNNEQWIQFSSPLNWVFIAVNLVYLFLLIFSHSDISWFRMWIAH